MSKIILITGGIRSGKSSFAEKKALFYQDRPIYVATAIGFDDEMRERISLHRKRREDKFITIEEPSDMVRVLSGLSKQTVLIDCITLNLSNRLLTNEHIELSWHIESGDRYLDDVINTARKNDLCLILVSNEVGSAPICDNRLGRFFQDLQGRWNCRLADAADEVYMLESGIPRLLKKQKNRRFRLGAPSYVLPADYLANVIYLQDKVEDIQLLLFDSYSEDPLFQNDTMQTLKYLAEGSGLSYSAHMPTGPSLWENYNLRLKETLLLLEKLQSLNVDNYTFHYDLPTGSGLDDLPEIKDQLDMKYIDYFNALKKEFPSLSFNLENTATSLKELDHVVKTCDLKYCADIGHYLKYGFDLSHISTRLASTSVIHLHGISDVPGTDDHKAVSMSHTVFGILKGFSGLVTVENYHPLVLQKSLDIINDYF